MRRSLAFLVVSSLAVAGCADLLGVLQVGPSPADAGDGGSPPAADAGSDAPAHLDAADAATDATVPDAASHDADADTTVQDGGDVGPDAHADGAISIDAADANATDAPTDAASDGDATTPCLTYGSAYCLKFQTCNPTGFGLAYGDPATCLAIRAQGCAAPTIPFTTGTVDPAACLAAISGTCDQFFEAVAHPPPACRANPGTLPIGGDAGCGYDVQCELKGVCDLSNARSSDPRCSLGVCAPSGAAGYPCFAPTDCDSSKSGLQCVASLAVDGGAPYTDGTTVCQTVTYGGLGAQCVEGTNRPCQAAFYCAASGQCVAKLGVHAPCPAAGYGECDDRINLVCVIPDGGTNLLCEPTVQVAQIGAACGGSSGNACAGTLYCDTSQQSPTCKSRIQLGGPCLSSIPIQCDYGLVCTSSTCATPPGPTCN